MPDGPRKSLQEMSDNPRTVKGLSFGVMRMTLRRMPRSAALGYIGAAVSAGVVGAGPAGAATFPTKPVRIIIPYAAGGSTDLVFRVLQPRLTKELGQSVVILNEPGGGGAIGINDVAKSAPDGYTLGSATLSFAANKYFIKTKLPYDPENDLVAVSMVTRIPEVLTVNKSVPVRSMREFIALAKEKPGSLNFGSSGIASDGELGAELFATMSGTKISIIPYSSTGAVQAIATDQVQVLVGPIPSSLPFIKSGALVPLGVTSLHPDPSLPNVPAIAQTVPGLELYSFQGLVAPAGTPRDVLERLHQAVARSLADPDVKVALARMGAQPVGDSPDAFGRYLKKQFALWSSVASKFQSSALQ